MYDVKLFQNLKIVKGGNFQKDITDEMIDHLEKNLNVILPVDYKIFLKLLGEGSIYDAPYILGINDKGEESVLLETEKMRREFGMETKYVVINVDEEMKTAKLLETTGVACEHCEVFEFNLKTKKSIKIADSFDAYFNNMLEMICRKSKIPLSTSDNQKTETDSLYIINETGIHMIQDNKVKNLPNGIGYKMGWIVIQDDNVELDDIVNKFNYMKKKIVEYENGI